MALCNPGQPDVGDQPTLWVDCTDIDGVPTSPSDGSLLIQKPGASVSTEVPFGDLNVEPDGEVGRVEYTLQPPIDVGGTWRFYWQFTAGIVAAEPFQFTANARTVPAPA